MTSATQRFLNFVQVSILCILSTSLYAQQFDQSYQTWKAQQQTHDQRLSDSSSSNYYLGKPSLATGPHSQKKTTFKSENAKTLGSKVNINTASTQELQQLNGIGEKKAQAIVDYRNQNGHFKTVNDLLNIKGIGPKFIEKNKSNLSL